MTKVVAYIVEDCPAPLGGGVLRRGRAAEVPEDHMQWMEEKGYAERVAEDVTKKDLYEEAKDLEISGRSKLSKFGLAVAIHNKRSK